MLKKLPRCVQAILARVPATLPQTPLQLDAMCQSVLFLAGAEQTSEMKGAVADILLRTDVRKTNITVRDLVLQLQRQIANEQAYALIQSLREAAKNQQLRTEAESSAQAQEADVDASAAAEGVADQVVS